MRALLQCRREQASEWGWGGWGWKGGNDSSAEEHPKPSPPRSSYTEVPHLGQAAHLVFLLAACLFVFGIFACEWCCSAHGSVCFAGLCKFVWCLTCCIMIHTCKVCFATLKTYNDMQLWVGTALCNSPHTLLSVSAAGNCWVQWLMQRWVHHPTLHTTT